MPDSSDAAKPAGQTPGKLTLKPRAREADQTQRPSKAPSTKSGARAHHQKRVQTEQRRTAAVTPEQTGPSPQASKTSRTKPSDMPSRSHHTRPGGRDSMQGSRPPRGERAPDRLERSAPRATRRMVENPIGNVPDATEVFTIFASCPRGLEKALGQELTAIGFTGVQAAQAGCRFTGHWQDVWRANLHSRLATRILVQVAHGKIGNEEDLRQLSLGVDWERWLGPQKTLRVDTSAIRSPMQSLQYCNLLVKDSVCDLLRDKEGARPSIDTVRPDVRVHSFLSHDSATLYLDTSGESLFKRGWRLDKAEAPIRENLAAGLLALSGWQPETVLLDPFCGSGTILIEAAWIALNIPPGINRPFAFERLRVHDAHAWQTMRQAATEAIKTQLPAPLIGCDLSARAIDAAQMNMKRAGLKPDTIQWRVADARLVQAPAAQGMIVTNPPYGERLEIEKDLMQAWAAQLKQQFAGWQVNVISADHGLPGAMRLKPRQRMPIFNGALDCRLFRFEMVNAHYDPKKQ